MLPKRITFGDKVLEEQTFDVQANLFTAIERLRETEDWDCETDTLGNPLQFGCNKKGKFVVYSAPRRRRSTSARLVDDRIYYLAGKVTAENGKTVVKLRTMRDHGALLGCILTIALYVAYVVLLFEFLVGMWQLILCVAIGSAIFVSHLWRMVAHLLAHLHNKKFDVEIMKEEVVHRIKAIDKWEE